MKFNSIRTGVVENAGWLLLAMLIYNLFLIKHVQTGNRFLGSFSFFAIEALAIPCINFALRNYRAAIGNVLGIAVYFVLAFCFMIFAGLFSGYHC